ncbi:DUF1572 family protein [Flavihumibacter profundi]|jgi:hypothetical protein|uniref:DUF1572 family protein n=1 Tax=Flavihumibacter profundi TaxID=2716883 RepID=UPI001CC57AED|nr:DUF1572 family protein [Flavihumibacter profundi]MBZ5856615.1 DUF1572 domain-containing protein [Flavihumibacter profundi]
MLIEIIRTLINRDLHKLTAEISAYRNESIIWKVDNSISNSAGNLCLHLVGNLNTYIGAEIGKTNYLRNRDLEFSLKDIPRSELLKKIGYTILMVNESLDKLNEEDLQKEYPLKVFEKEMSTEYFMVHLATHLSYHLGQINYHRRLLDA